MGWKDLAVSLLPQCKDVYILANMGERICLLWQVIILLLSPLTSSESNSEIKLAKLVFFCLKLPEIPNSDLPLTLVVFRADIINLSQHFVYAELSDKGRGNILTSLLQDFTFSQSCWRQCGTIYNTDKSLTILGLYVYELKYLLISLLPIKPLTNTFYLNDTHSPFYSNN